MDVTWDGGSLSLPVPTGDEATGETVRLLRGARLIADWEARYPASEAFASADRRKQSRVAARLRALSEEYGLASREMSLVAVLKRGDDREGVLPKTIVTATGVAPDISFDAYFGAPPPDAFRDFFGVLCTATSSPPPAVMSALNARITRRRPVVMAAAVDPQAQLVEIAARLEGDGGMLGDSFSRRVAASITALFAFVAAGHTRNQGAFRQHVARLISFLKSAAGLSKAEQRLVDLALDMASHGKAPRENWPSLALQSAECDVWPEIEKSLQQAARA